MTDVLLGTIIGFGIGYSVPTLLHYHVPGSSPELRITSAIGGADAGIGIGGRF
jgi:hypothetical protein